MKQKIYSLFTLCMLCAIGATAQTKIGGVPGPADPSAYLQLGDATGANKGLLLSRVNLTATTIWGLASATPTTAGMVVYNTNPAITGPNADGVGLYYWDGSVWVRVKGNNMPVIFIYGDGSPVTNNVPCSATNNTNTIYTDTLEFINNNPDLPNPTFGKQWVCDGTSWKSYTSSAQTEWFLSKSFNDAGGEKVARIFRQGWVGITEKADTAFTPGAALHIKGKFGLGNDIIMEGIGDDPTLIMLNRPATGNLQPNTIIANLTWSGYFNGSMRRMSGINSTYKGDGTTFKSDLKFLNSGNIERMRIDSNGYVGIGPFTELPPSSKLHILDDDDASGSGDDLRISSYHSSTAPAPNMIMESGRGTYATPANLQYGDAIGQINFRGRSNNAMPTLGQIISYYRGNGTTNFGDMSFKTSGATRIYIDSIGFVGVGTTTPAAPLHVNGSLSRGILVNMSNADYTGFIYNGTASQDGVDISNNSVRIQKGSGGTGAPLILTKATGYTSNLLAEFMVNGTRIGSITTTGTATAFNTTSDIRLKENIVNTTYGIKDVMKFKVYNYNYKSDNNKSLTTGFLAQELYKEYPQAVTVGGEDAKTEPWQVDYSKLVPVLTKAIQDQQSQIEKQQTQIDELKAQVKALQGK